MPQPCEFVAQSVSAVLTFFLFNTGSSPTQATKFFRLGRLHLCFLFHKYVNLICVYIILLIKIYITKKNKKKNIYNNTQK